MSDDARMLALLESIEARLSRLESRLEILDAVPGAIAAAVDTVDSRIDALQEAGAGVDARLHALIPTVERLSRPDTLATLRTAVDLADSLPAVVATAVDVADGLARRLQEAGIDLDARAAAVLALAERVSRPETLAVLGQAVQLLEESPQLAATVVDIADGVFQRLQQGGMDLDQRLRALLEASDMLSRPETLDLLRFVEQRGPALLEAGKVLLESGVFDLEPVETIGHAATALAGLRGDDLPPVGAWALMRSLSDPDVARAVSFGREFARRFGSRLHDPA